MSSLTAKFEVVNSAVSTRFSNASNYDFVMFTSDATQKMHFGNVLGSTSAIEVSQTDVTMNTDVDLKGVLKHNGVTVIDANGNVIGAAAAVSLPLEGGSMTGQIGGYAPDSAAAPAYAWSNDLNTGFFQKAAGTIGVSCDGAESMALSNLGVAVNGNLSASNMYSKGIRISN